tara:strand:- start:1183 stop:1656 length:474 start_codon:yes stop_codon:yes gene_type:complete
MSIIPVLGIDPTAVHANDTSQRFRSGQLGAVIGETTKLYKYVQNYSFIGIAPGDVCSYLRIIDTHYFGNEVTNDVSLTHAVGAGVAASTSSTYEWFWIQIRGPATLSTALTAGADGDPLTTEGAGDRTLDVVSSVTDNVCAIACDASDKEIICMFPY